MPAALGRRKLRVQAKRAHKALSRPWRNQVRSRANSWRREALAMGKAVGVLLIILGVIANNVVYLQDLWLGQGYMSLDGWPSYAGLLVSIVIILLGTVLLARPRTAD
jgi:protein-S-isoprenylcysteine O-methyltransferase Ste14